MESRIKKKRIEGWKNKKRKQEERVRKVSTGVDPEGVK